MKKIHPLIMVLTAGMFISCTAAIHRETPHEKDKHGIIELVESIPLETGLDCPGIRNTAVVWLEMIRNAERTIDLEQFYMISKSGEPFDTVITEIIRASRRGVRVRLIVDSKMHRTYPGLADSMGRMNNILLRIIDFSKMTGGVQHAKYFIVDGEQVFMGSQNFDWRAVTHIHEVGVRVRHPSVAGFYQRIFDLDWQIAENNDMNRLPDLISYYSMPAPVPITVTENDTVYVIPTASPAGWIPDTNSWDESRILELINGAKNDLRIQFMLYGTHSRKEPDYRVLDDAIRNAAARGVKVNIIAADWIYGRSAEKDLKALSKVPGIQVKISEIPGWSGGYVSFARVEHCKYIIADSEAFWIGTSNAEKSYFYTSRNLGMVMMNSRLAGQMIEKFNKGWNSSYTVSIDPSKTYEPRKRGEE